MSALVSALRRLLNAPQEVEPAAVDENHELIEDLSQSACRLQPADAQGLQGQLTLREPTPLSWLPVNREPARVSVHPQV
jgi:hypothetical protein